MFFNLKYYLKIYLNTDDRYEPPLIYPHSIVHTKPKNNYTIGSFKTVLWEKHHCKGQEAFGSQMGQGWRTCKIKIHKAIYVTLHFSGIFFL